MKSSFKIDFFEDGTPFILIKDYAKNDMYDVRDKLIRNFVHDAHETGLKIIPMRMMDECDHDGTGSHFAVVPNGKSTGEKPSIYYSPTEQSTKEITIDDTKESLIKKLDVFAKEHFEKNDYKNWEGIYNLFINDGKPYGS